MLKLSDDLLEMDEISLMYNLGDARKGARVGGLRFGATDKGFLRVVSPGTLIPGTTICDIENAPCDNKAGFDSIHRPANCFISVPGLFDHAES